jgi:hypothetical protein
MRQLAIASRVRRLAARAAACLALAATALPLGLPSASPAAAETFTSDFMLDSCGGFSATGRNPFFILEPGHRLQLEGREDGEDVVVVIKVLRETRRITGVWTRVVEERETKDGTLVEVSRNFFAICNRNNNVLYFGEEVDIYDEDGVTVVSHDGAWRAGVRRARPGVIMPGTIMLGARYMQEVAPGVAMDQGENVGINLVVTTPAGTFEGCIEIRETTPLEPGSVGTKLYCPGIGLVGDGELRLTSVSN